MSKCKRALMSVLGLFDVRKWKKRTCGIVLFVLIALVAASVLSCFKPEQADMVDAASEQMKEEIRADQDRSRKYVTITYNSLYFISYSSFEISGANASIERYVGFAGQIYSADEGAAKTVGQLINFTYRMLGCGQSALYGVKLTLLLTLLSVITGFLLSIFLALGKISKRSLISAPCSAYIFFFRGTPLLIQLMCIYYGIPTLAGFAWKDIGAHFVTGPDAVFMGAFIAAYISFSLNSAAYCAEIVRAAILSIDKGQHEAAKALGMNYAQTMRLIIIPQSVGRLSPPVANEFIMVLKDASLVFAISLMDITTISKNIYTSYNTALAYVPALIIYLIITALFGAVFNRLEAKFSRYL